MRTCKVWGKCGGIRQKCSVRAKSAICSNQRVQSPECPESGIRRRRLETLGGAPAIPPHKGAVATTRRFTLDLSASLQLTQGASLAYTLRYSPETLVGAIVAAALGEETVRRLAHAGHTIAHVAHATQLHT